jgi:acyl-homoserine lactone synthase
MLYVVSGHDASNYPSLMDQVHCLRHKVFVEELGWTDLESPDGRERDQFDRPDAIHHICVQDDKVVGYQRMLPTVRPHLLSDVFPELCDGPSPRALNTYELTRYCVAPTHREGRRGVSTVGSELMAGFVEWGLACQVNNVIIEFETIWVLRSLQLKFFVRPLGLETQIGKQKIVATQLTFNDSTLRAIRDYRQYWDPVVTYLGELEVEPMAIAV